MFTPLSSLLGGTLIGAAAAALLLLHGRLAGVSGIVAGALPPRAGDGEWRLLFLAGLVAGGVIAGAIAPTAFAVAAPRSPLLLVVAGLLVGVGTRLGNGCTSGHGVCGLGRGSPRSLAAVITFMLTGAAAVALLRHFGGLP